MLQSLLGDVPALPVLALEGIVVILPAILVIAGVVALVALHKRDKKRKAELDAKKAEEEDSEK